MNNRKQNKQPLFAEVNLTGDEFQKSPDTFFGACKVKGKNLERWLAYVLDHIGSTKMKIYTNCFLSFGKTLTESTLSYK